MAKNEWLQHIVGSGYDHASIATQGLYRGVVENPMRLGVYLRSDDVVEPMIKPQWYASCVGMAEEACAAVCNGQLDIIPKHFEDTWFRWLENIRDWCISRQLWWGHHVLAWFVTLEDDELREFGAYNDHWIVGQHVEEAKSLALEKYQGKRYKLEFRVRDTTLIICLPFPGNYLASNYLLK